MGETFYEDGVRPSFTESILVHPSHTDGLVNSNDPVYITGSELPGVAEIDAAATTDKIPILIKGVAKLSVHGEDAAGNAAIAEGALLYFDTDGEINADATNGKKFGVALAAVGSGVFATTPVLLGKF